MPASPTSSEHSTSCWVRPGRGASAQRTMTSHGRDRGALPMEVVLGVEDVDYVSGTDVHRVRRFHWYYDPGQERPCGFDIVCSCCNESFRGNNATREQLACVVVGADHRLGCQLSYSSKWTLLSRLMRKFHDRLVADPRRVERLRERFDQVVSILHEVSEFKAFGEELQAIAGELAANLSYGLDLDVSADRFAPYSWQCSARDFALCFTTQVGRQRTVFARIPAHQCATGLRKQGCEWSRSPAPRDRRGH